MKRFAMFSLLASALLLVGAACTGSVNENANVTANPSPSDKPEKIIFSPPESLAATQGTAYSYSFCKPDSARSGATCGGAAGATQNPIRGNPPYSFSHQSGSGALPPGLALALNGLLNGTPTLAGEYSFGVCASDGADEACATTTLTVKPNKETPSPKKSLKTSTSGTGQGTISVNPRNPDMMFNLSSAVKLTAVPAAGSTFDHWAGDCSGSGSCSLTMVSNKTVTAVFNVINVTPKVTADVSVSSLACNWTVKTGDYGAKSDCVRIISQGTAQGPVGARVELPILSWSDDKFDCGAWTLQSGALVAVGSTCVRKEGQPETTSWTVDTEGNECPLKDYFNNNRSYSAKIYLNGDLTPQKTGSKTAVCQ